MTGIATAEVAMGHASAITNYFKAEDAPVKLPPKPFATWCVNAYLRCKEARVGSE